MVTGYSMVVRHKEKAEDIFQTLYYDKISKAKRVYKNLLKKYPVVEGYIILVVVRKDHMSFSSMENAKW